MAPSISPASYPRTQNTLNGTPACTAASISASKPTGIVKRPPCRPTKTHPKVLGPLDAQYDAASAIQTSRLLSLPPEIRALIWQHVLTSPDQTLRYDTARLRFDTKDIAAGLPLTCHQIALETWYLPLRINRLCFDSIRGFLRWQRRLTRVEGKLGWKVRVTGILFV